MPKSVEEEMVRHSSVYYREVSHALVKRLREMADRVERVAQPDSKPSVAGTPRYSQAAEQVLNAMSWDLANAQACRLVGAAGRADAAEAWLDVQRLGVDTKGKTPKVSGT